ncbi:MAG: methyltransferase [Gemmobacter sp.]|nr:methyltransferase [Gemmobacter sp.]
MRSVRISHALDTGALSLPESGRIAVFRPRAGDDLSALPRDRVQIVTVFKPDHDAFAAQGYACVRKPDGAFAGALVCLPRAKAAALALIAQAMAAVPQGGQVIVDGQKTDGVDSVFKQCRAAGLTQGEALSKAHGKVFSIVAGPAPDGWAAVPQVVDGFTTLPGVFSADGPDRGSVLLAQALPEKLGARVADLGAGWGYLTRAILERPGVTEVQLIEADSDALDCARLNITDPRARFHWADATRFHPDRAFDTVVMNPPFHTTRDADPGLGAAFIRAAAAMLSPGGSLWMVGNRHLPYERVLAETFREVEQIGGDSAFRLYRAARPLKIRP